MALLKLSFIVFSLCVVITCATDDELPKIDNDYDVGTASDCCDAGWRQYEDRCFNMPVTTPNRRDWENARSYCNNARSGGAELARVDSSGLNDFMVQRMIEGNEVWIGLNDRSVEGTFRWDDNGDYIGYTNFDKDEPNDGGLFSRSEDCVEMLKTGKWNDEICKEERRFVCQHYADTRCQPAS